MACRQDARMSPPTLVAFDALCARLVRVVEPQLGVTELEPYYVEFLNFLSTHADERALLAARIMEIMGAYRSNRARKQPLLPISAIAYAMHELRWPEVLEFAERENAVFYARTKSTFMTSLIDAFDDAWEDRTFYRRFAVE